MLFILQIIFGVLIIIFILLQSRGVGIGSAWGGGGEFYATRRGVERLLFQATILLVSLFVIISLVAILS